TPMENRVEEFRNLIEHLQPELAVSIDRRQAIAAPKQFRRSVAPVYLRRNQEDVLQELPDLTRVDEWVELGRAGPSPYRTAVMAGNFMAMRRAAFVNDQPRHSSKLKRLVELVDECAANGRKVVVFSYFRDVLDIVCSALGGSTFGPLTGSTHAA